MENTVTEDILALLDENKLQEITKAAEERMANIKANLIERSSTLADPEMYKKLIDYSCDQVNAYITNPENMQKVLTDPKNIEEIFAKMTDSEEFKNLAGKEYMGLPKITAMAILTGTEGAAVLDAAEILENSTDAEREYLAGIAATYQKYMQDAISYAVGDKKVSVVGA